MKTMKFATISRITAGLATVGLLTLSGTSYAAGTAAFSLSPASAAETQGATFSVAVYEDGSNVNVVTANFSYDSGLQFIGAACAGAFSGTAASSGSSISCFVPGGSAVSGIQQVASLSFKAVAVESANVTITGSTIGSAGSNVWNGVSASADYTVTAPVSSGGSGGTSGGGSSTGQTGTGSANGNSAPVSGKSSGATAGTGSQLSTTGTATTTGTTQQSKNNGKTSGKQNKKSSVPVRHVSSHHAGLVTSGISVLVVVVVGLYWFFVRKTPVAVEANAKVQTAKNGQTTHTASGRKTKTSRQPKA